MKISNKNFGLDFIRAMAILLVLISHSVFSFNMELIVKFFPFGFYGVELFFVLSGFLIGQIIIKDILQKLSFKNLVNFWIRRWFRTLPLYYLCLILRNIFLNDGTGFQLKYYFFLQNFFFKTGGGWFAESWSLVIEEWFYFIIPLVIFVFYKLKILQDYKKLSGLLIFLIFLSFIIRTFYVFTHSHFDYSLLRTSVPFRLEALMMGVLVASIKIYHNSIYKILSSPFTILSSLTVFIILQFGFPNILTYDFIGIKTWAGSIGFSLTSFLFVLFIPYCEASITFNNISNIRSINIIIRKLSLYTYSIYLIHGPIFKKIVTQDYFSFIWFYQVLLALTVVIICAATLFHFFEKPIMDLRDKIKL